VHRPCPSDGDVVLTPQLVLHSSATSLHLPHLVGQIPATMTALTCVRKFDLLAVGLAFDRVRSTLADYG
jgi:hypothetical protein